MRLFFKRIIRAINWRIKGARRRLFPPHLSIKVKDNGVDNIVDIDGKPQGGKLLIVFNGDHNRVCIRSGCHLYCRSTVFIVGNNNRVFIGKNTTFDGNVLLVPGEGTQIIIGDDCQFAANVTIRTTDQHPIYDAEGRRVNPAKDINIGEHVWLGAHTVVMKGVTIGKGTVVGYGSIITKSLPDNCVAVGSPAHVVKENIEWCRTFKKA